MADIVKTMKLHIHTEETDALKALTKRYMEACNHISDYIFEHHFILNALK